MVYATSIDDGWEMTECLTKCLNGWLAEWQTERLNGWLTKWLTWGGAERLADWLAEYWIELAEVV